MSGSIQNPQSQTHYSLHSLQRDPEVTAQVQSPNFSSPSCLHFSHQSGLGGAQGLGKEKSGSTLSPARVGFLSLPYHPQDQGKFLLSEEGTLLKCRRMTFKAMGRHSSPGGPDDRLPASVLAAFCSNLMHTSASSLHSSGVKCN